MSKQTIIDESIIPSGDPVWLNKTNILPTPEEVKAWPDELKNRLGERIVRFSHLNLIVKHGTETRTTEGKALWMISQYCGDIVPIPEVYGWCTCGEDTFLYMQLVEGATLQECWATLREEDKGSIADQLSVAFSSVRSLRQDPSDIYVGSLHHGPTKDQIWRNIPDAATGPFNSAVAFADAILAIGFRNPDESEDVHQQYRTFRNAFPDNVQITFTHADLAPSNIMVSTSGSPRVTGIIDWHEAGWYPEYWEYTKTVYNSDIWDDHFLERFLALWNGPNDVLGLFGSWGFIL